MKVYRGSRGIDGLAVTVGGTPLDPRYDLKRIARGGFEWTYEGEGPAQLALALLADCLQDDQRALELHEGFMRQVIADLDNDWQLTSENILDSLARLETNRA